MDVPGQPGAMFALLAVFIAVGFLFRLGLAKGRMSGRQQTLAGVVRGNAQARAVQGVREASSRVEVNQAGAGK